MGLLVAVSNAASSQVVCRNLDLNSVSGKDTDVMLTHLAAQMAKNFVPIVQLDAEVTAL